MHTPSRVHASLNHAASAIAAVLTQSSPSALRSLHYLDAAGQAHCMELLPEQAGAQGRARFQDVPATATSSCLLWSGEPSIGDAPAGSALFLEFGAAAEPLAGWCLCLPWQLSAAGELRVGHVRVHGLPDHLRARSDELLLQFSRALRRLLGKTAWARLLLVDPAAPLAFDDAALAGQLRQLPVDGLTDDDGPDSNQAAARLLDALLYQRPLAGGMTGQADIAQLRLDFSLDSLSRVFDFAAHCLADGEQHSPLASPAQRNLLQALAVYCGTVVARQGRARADWLTPRQDHAVGEGAPAGDSQSLQVLFNRFSAGERRLQPQSLLLQVVQGHQSAEEAAAQLRAVAEGLQADEWIWLQGLREDVQLLLQFTQELEGEVPAVPVAGWYRPGEARGWQAAREQLYEFGEVVWGCVIQVDEAAFSEGADDVGALILYDPSGSHSATDMLRVASLLEDLHGVLPHDPRLAWISSCLGNPGLALDGFLLPAHLHTAPLRLSRLLLHRPHLPEGRLGSTFLPLLVHPQSPHIAMPLPWGLWPDELLLRCARIGWQLPAQELSEI